MASGRRIDDHVRKKICDLYYKHGMTQGELRARFEISQGAVSRIIREAASSQKTA